jgi:signal transduction histidine kinase
MLKEGVLSDDLNCGRGAVSVRPLDAQRPTSDDRAAVWIVDDSPLQRELSRQALCVKYAVTVYANGPAMLEDLACSRTPDVLVLDWHMPEMSGIDVCRFVRGSKDLAELPILMLTSIGTSDTLLEALAAGANDFVRIPFSELELSARISALVNIASLHAELAEAERRLRLEADFRERFMGMLAHDLRQPLNAIFMTNAALARPETAPGDASKFVGMQLRAAERMKRMIAELLDFTRNRPESGMPIQPELTDFAEVTRATLEEIRPGHPDHTVELGVEGSCTGHWDPDRLAQMCSNLIGNAIEHSSRGTSIDVRLIAHPAHVEFRVVNRGAVIPPDVLATLFQPFRRGPEMRRSSSGVGLGLHIVDQITRAHGGMISVHSEDDATEFIVRLPRETTVQTGDNDPVSGYAPS